jgi:hypothetical protein
MEVLFRARNNTPPIRVNIGVDNSNVSLLEMYVKATEYLEEIEMRIMRKFFLLSKVKCK